MSLGTVRITMFSDEIMNCSEDTPILEPGVIDGAILYVYMCLTFKLTN